MINYVRFNNFYSFAEETEVSFRVGKQPTMSLYDIQLQTVHGEEVRLNKVITTLGANGSGKTQLLKALPFLAWFVSLSSQSLEKDDEISFSPFKAKENEKSTFEISFFLKKGDQDFDEYRYNLILDKEQVYFEALYVKTSRSFSYIFERDLEKNIYKHRNFLTPKHAKDVNKNVSLISYANIFDNEIASSVVKFFRGFKFNLHSLGRKHSSDDDLIKISESLSKDMELKNEVVRLLSQFDTGISDIKFEKIMLVEHNSGETKEVLMPVGIHKYNDSEMEFYFLEESNGTRSAFVLMGLLLPLLRKGGVAIIDELDNDLHPHLLPRLLDLFKHKHSNPHDAQIIFSCHTPEILNLLYKHQVYMVQKNNQESESWRLDEVTGLRADDNIYAKYMSGALDAVPNI